MKIHIENVPFARWGSYLTFSVLPPEWGQKGLVLRTMHKKGQHQVFEMKLLRDGKEVEYSVEATPTLATLTPKSGKGKVEICLPETDVARFRCEGLGLRLESITVGKGCYAYPFGEDSWNVNNAKAGCNHQLIPITGSMDVDSILIIGDHKRGKHNKPKPIPDRPAVIAEFLPDESGLCEFAVYQFMMSPQPVTTLGKSFEQCRKLAEKDWKAWLKTKPSLPKQYRDAADHAMHVNYASTVGPWERFKRDVTLMSRNWMTSCWSWDHCFNAIAYSYKAPDQAWDQLNVHFDLQEPGGCLPDGVSAENAGWNYCKPPIHGWALSKMMKNKKLLTEKRLKEFYPKLVKWTNWWFECRDRDGDGLPEYQHGNDSGWDNATVFDEGFPVAGADLQAFLILQMDQLAEMAKRLGKDKAAKKWKKRADNHLKLMIEKLWDGDQFHCKKAFTYEYVQEGDCLLNHMPIVLGKRLPKKYREKICEALKPGGRFMTEYGLATENPESPRYIESGYWRGPIWGPEVVLITDGLWRGGHKELARESARRYCDMCLKSELFAENFDPLSGEPLCDKAYTWGSSSYLILAHEYLK